MTGGMRELRRQLAAMPAPAPQPYRRPDNTARLEAARAALAEVDGLTDEQREQGVPFSVIVAPNNPALVADTARELLAEGVDGPRFWAEVSMRIAFKRVRL